MTGRLEALERDGFAVVADVVSADVLGRLALAFAHGADGDDGAVGAGGAQGARRRRRDGRVYAVRNVLELPAVAELGRGGAVRAIVEPVLGPGARAVRGIFFDKTAGANWKVAWHQDLSIAVRGRVGGAAAYGPWSVKAGVVHVQPPRGVLESLLTVRLHLDDCGDDNGPLKVVPGSHAHGVLPPAEVERRVREGPVVACTVAAGGAVLMRPLILHASSAATTPGHRRVVHLEFAAGALPGGVEWYVSAG